MTDDSEGNFERSRRAEFPMSSATRPSLGRSWSSASTNSRTTRKKNAGEILEMRRQQLEILLELRDKEMGLKENKPTSPWINLSPAVSLDLLTPPSQSRNQGKENASGLRTCKDGEISPSDNAGFTFPTKQIRTHNNPVSSLPKLETAPVALSFVAPPVGTPPTVEPFRDSRVRFVVEILPARHNPTPSTKLSPVLQADIEQRRAERASRRAQAGLSDIPFSTPLSPHGPIDHLSSSPNPTGLATAVVATTESLLAVYQCPLLEACKDFCWYHTN